jgi:hypothetical protein
VLLGQVGHRLPVAGVGTVDQGALGTRAAAVQGLQARRHDGRVARDQDERALGGRADGANRVGELRGATAVAGLHSESIQRQVHADVAHAVGVGGCNPGFDIGRGDVIRRYSVRAHAHEQPRLVEERLLVPEQHGLVASLDFAAVGLERHQPDGRLGCVGQLGLRLRAHVWAGRQLDLLGGQLHRKGEAGGQATILAVRLGQQFVDLNTGKWHL